MRTILILIQSTVQSYSGDYWNDTNDDTDYGYGPPNYNHSYTPPKVWHGDSSTTIEVSSHYSDNEAENIFDDNNETVWTSEFGSEQESNSTLSLTFTDYYAIKSISLSFPDYYQTIPEISIFTGSTLHLEWSIDDPLAMLTQFKNTFVTGTGRLIKFETIPEYPVTTKELKIVFSHECEYVAISDLKMEYEIFDSNDTITSLAYVETFWFPPQYYVDGDWLPNVLDMPPTVVIKPCSSLIYDL